MHEQTQSTEARRPWGLAALLVLAMALFVGLGVWQVQRLHWKHALIARVNARVEASPLVLPPDDWLEEQGVKNLEYLRVSVLGQYDGKATALVRAATDLGTGYWTMTPMRIEDGRLLWINRGFVPAGTTVAAAAATTPKGDVRVIGLLRPSEPKGNLFQSNRPQDDRWYSRDIAALSADRKVGPVVSAFVDAQTEKGSRPAGLRPVPGLTQIHFPDNHLSYALTWFAMAALSLVGLVVVFRGGRWKA